MLALLWDLISFSNLQKYSCHAQTVAGVFSLLNDFRLSKNKTSLGFINPLIYSTAKTGFNDIKSGSNPGCGTTGKAVSYLKLKHSDGLIRVHCWCRMGSSEYIFLSEAYLGIDAQIRSQVWEHPTSWPCNLSFEIRFPDFIREYWSQRPYYVFKHAQLNLTQISPCMLKIIPV